MADMHQVFQTAKPPDLHPWPQDATERERAFLVPHLAEVACTHPRSFCAWPPGDDAALVLELQVHAPCLGWRPQGLSDGTGCDWVLMRDSGPGAEAMLREILGGGAEIVATEPQGQPTLRLLR